MKDAILLDRAGRVVLPSEVRRQLNLRPGSGLRIAVIAERIELTPESEPELALATTPGKRKVLKRTGAAFDAAEATRIERDAQARRRSRR